MSESDLAKLDRDALIALILKLQAEIEALKRSGKRQAAPFSKGTRKADPKRPGRKPGEGSFKTREAPAPETLSEPPIDVPVVEAECPKCGGELDEGRVEEASITDLPEVVRPRVRLFRVGVRRCKRCKATARGRHPDLAADQRGATAHRLGPRILAAAHFLHYGLGVPVRKLPALLEALVGVRLTQGAITLDALKKAAGAIGATYRNLCDSVREAPFVHTDDTGWREGGSPRWLMVFETDAATVYQVRPRHRNEEVRERIPADYRGVMITDRAGVYDAEAFAGVEKQKCLAHALRSISEVLESKTRGARRFAKRLKDLLKRALELGRERRAGPPPADFAGRVRRLKFALTDHLRDRTLRDRDDQRLLNELGRCNDAGSLVRFLDDPRVEPTNNRAERALRPAVIARKTSQCTKNARGTRAFEAWTSVLRTLSRTLPAPDLLDDIVRITHPAAPPIS
ncbi:IS66 family transposase [Planctomyces sp. SH-PL62]|uniref:IS66 family transposase n=1 Tax=Planctomyces sp. SH-PL62 TaxID=1636152 RepID=UPI00078B361C|nr:IS66 family transposase [Planctomyces sp. SH-PL62]AMV40944.1 Transposase IS66 family protein [Planctomyces sp. SH-PL62]AMV40968.1 Transposase IS66 family protein [Planctomyces sp. SH-PL62]